MLTDDQRQEFDEQGFLVLRNVLNGSILERITAAAQEVEAHKRSERGLSDKDTLEVRNAIVEHDAFWELLDYPQTFPLVLDLMGGDIQLSTSHLIVRPPVPGDTPKTFKAIGWHPDSPHAIAYDGRIISMKFGYFLSDVSKPGSGALLVVPGSHKGTQLERGADGEVPEDKVFEVNALPGDAVLFQHRTYHSVGPNYSGHPRKVLYFGYNRRWLRPIDYVTMPEEILQRFDPTRRQLLGDTITQCGYYLPKPEDEPLKVWLNGQLKQDTVRNADTDDLYKSS